MSLQFWSLKVFPGVENLLQRYNNKNMPPLSDNTSTVSKPENSLTILVSSSRQSKGVVVPQVFKINLNDYQEYEFWVYSHLLFDMNIELSDNTYASTWELLTVETIEQCTMDNRHSRLDLRRSQYLVCLSLVVTIVYYNSHCFKISSVLCWRFSRVVKFKNKWSIWSLNANNHRWSIWSLNANNYKWSLWSLNVKNYKWSIWSLNVNNYTSQVS